MPKVNSLIFMLLCSSIMHANHSDTTTIRNHLTAITKTKKYRTYDNLEALNWTAQYIYDQLATVADTVYFQNYDVDGNTYKNVIAILGSEFEETVVVGAHYDACGNQEAADDNATGVVGLLELARLLDQQPLSYRMELVAYSLEEPPYFRTENMGSYIHAKSLNDEGRNVYGMMSLEMLGYFDSSKGSQHYPVGILSWFYGNRGDFIAIINKFGKGAFARRFTKLFKRNKQLKVKSLAAPPSLEGVDFSDHLNYWKFDYSAMMITDTAFMRNMNYHKKTDTMETLDIPMMAKVIDTLYLAILQLNKR